MGDMKETADGGRSAEGQAPPEGGAPPTGLAEVLARVRREGFWVLAGLAALPSVNVVALVAGPGSAKHATRLAPGDLILAVLALAGLIEVLRCRRPWRRAIVPAAAFAWVAAASISALVMLVREWGDLGVRPALGSVKEIVQLVEIIVVGYGWAKWAPERKRCLDRALYAMGAAVTVNVLFALGQLAAGAHPFHVRGLFAHRNTLGAFLAVTLPVLVAVASARSRRPTPVRWPTPVRIWFLAVAAMGLAVVTSGPLLAAVIVGILVAAFAGGKRAGAAALGAVAMVVLVIQPAALRDVRHAQLRSAELFPADGQGRRAPSMRLRRWAAALECMREHPTVGVGPGRFQARITEGDFYLPPPFNKPFGSSGEVTDYDVRFDEPGSQGLYEVTVCETGLLGLLAVVAFLASALVRSARSAARYRSGLGAGAMGATVALLVAGVFASVMVQGVALVFMIVLAMGECMGVAEIPRHAADRSRDGGS